MLKLSIIVPVFNEEKTISSIIDCLTGLGLPTNWQKEIIIVNDGSTDSTAAILGNMPKRSDLITINKSTNGGKGSALKVGFRWATGDYLTVQDGDLEYDPNDYRQLLACIDQGSKVAFGSRVLGHNNVSFSRIYFYGGLLVTKIFNLFFGTKLTDVATCYKVFPRALVDSNLLNMPNNDFVFDVVELSWFLATRSKVVEMPISYCPRSKAQGKKINWRHGWRCLGAMFLIRLNLGVYRRPGQLEFWYQPLRYLVSGLVGALVNLLLMYSLVEWLQIWYIYAGTIAFLLSSLVGFTLHKLWTFRNYSRHYVSRQLLMYVMIGVVNIGLNTLIIFLLVEHFHFWYLLAQILSSAFIAVAGFFIYRRIVFGLKLKFAN